MLTIGVNTAQENGWPKKKESLYYIIGDLKKVSTILGPTVACLIGFPILLDDHLHLTARSL